MIESWALSERTYEPEKALYSYGASFDQIGSMGVDNNLIYHKDKEGTERFWEYDDKANKLLSYRDSNGTKHEWKYDDEGNMIYRDDEHGKARYSFDKSGIHLIESEGKNNDVHSIRYDDEGGFKYFWNRRMIVPKEPKEEPPF
jgi:YD repeat-containing protein